MRIPLTLLAILIPTVAWAHGPAKWIMDGGYRSAMGTTCCSSEDCREGGISNITLSSDGGMDFDVIIEGKTYRLHVLKESIHYKAPGVAPWSCALPQDYLAGRARCLFLPGGA
jgi:hypothetical protein